MNNFYVEEGNIGAIQGEMLLYKFTYLWIRAKDLFHYLAMDLKSY